MSFCIRCGAQVSGNFCPSCGTPIGGSSQPQPPEQPQPSQAQFPPAQFPAQAAPPAAPKKRGPLFYGLIGCGVLIGLGLIAVIAGGLFVAHKAKEAGLDPDLAQRNPALAAAKLLVSVNRELELVSSDDARGTVTIREKRTGKTMTVNLEDIKRGRIVFQGDDGQRVELEGSESGARIRTNEGTVEVGAGARLPAWVPVYPGAKVEGGLSATSNGDESGTASLKTPDPVERVAVFFENGFEKAGLTVEKNAEGSGTVISGKDGSGRIAAAIINRAGSETTVSLTFETKR